MVRVTKALKRPFTTVRQVLEDYQAGRDIRRMPLIVMLDKKEECKEECNKECKEDHNKECKDETLNEYEEECEGKYGDFNKDQCKDKTRSLPVGDKEDAARYAERPRISWRYNRRAEFPWMLQQPVCKESNWKGTWVLQVKDMNAMNWEMDAISTEIRKGQFVEIPTRRGPTRQLPFPFGEESSVLPPEGGQDDMMVWLGKS